MPIKPENKDRYPPDWPAISYHIRFERARGRCEICGIAVNGMPSPWTGSKVVLTVMHLNHTPEDCRYINLKAGCQRCHIGYDTACRKTERERDQLCLDLLPNDQNE